MMPGFACYCFLFSFLSLAYCLRKFVDFWPRDSQQVGTWPDGLVPYAIDDEFTIIERLKINSAIDHLHRFSCVRFVALRQASLDFIEDYVFITPGEKKKCSSFVGNVGIGMQTVQLAPHCFQRSTILHELMHSLGFHHEHSRRDRDAYIRILWYNLNPNFTSHFNIQNVAAHTYQTPYDESSIMHYDSLMGSGNGNPTILKQLPTATWPFLRPFMDENELWIKPASSLSLMDAARLNILYNCDMSACMNYYPYCDQYERIGACHNTNAQFMRMLCKLSCGGQC